MWKVIELTWTDGLLHIGPVLREFESIRAAMCFVSGYNHRGGNETAAVVSEEMELELREQSLVMREVCGE